MDRFAEQFHQDPDHVEWVRHVLVFDNATVHTAKEEDALSVVKLNVNPGGKQPKMKDGWYHNEDGHKVMQRMQFQDGSPKGMRQILEERGYITQGMREKDLQNALSKEPDFEEDKKHTILRDAVYRKNEYAVVMYSPKYHCELNPKEMHWNSGKKKYRNQQDFSNVKKPNQIIKQIHECLDAVPIKEIKNYIDKSILYSEAYRGGATTSDILQRVQRLKSARKVKRKIYT